MMHPVIPYVVASLLFGLGVFGVLRRRNAILLLMAVELMLNAVNLILVTAGTAALTGQVFALFVIVIAAAEVGVGLAIVLQLYRLRASTALDAVPLTEPESGAASLTEPGSGAAPLAEPESEATPLAEPESEAAPR